MYVTCNTRVHAAVMLKLKIHTYDTIQICADSSEEFVLHEQDCYRR